MIHPIISGNKWRKLREYIQLAQFNGHKHLISFGGAYSNHLYALSFAAKEFGLRATGIIRGEELNPRSNIYLAQMMEWGMELKFVTRTNYQQKIIPAEVEIDKALLIPEGGFGQLACDGVASIMREVGQSKFQHIFCSIGTGATYLGLCQSAKGSTIHGVLTLNNLAEINEHAERLKINTQQIYADYIFGKYAKQPKELVQFCDAFEDKHDIKIEPIYTGKMFYGLYDLIQHNKFKSGSTILAIHTGGVKS